MRLSSTVSLTVLAAALAACAANPPALIAPPADVANAADSAEETMPATPTPPATTATAEDPHRWLEEIEGDKALTQVKAWNSETDAALTAMAGYADKRARALAIQNDPAQLALPTVIGDKVLNHWVDANHKRGLWRIADLAAYRAGKPDWKVLIDVDALGKAEGKSWVWHGASCLAPDYRRCLVSLSPGGTDADVVREFDLSTGQFVDGGFSIPESKNGVAWVDQDTILVGLVQGEGTATRSGYPRTVKLLKRGQALADAPVVAEGVDSDISVSPASVMDGDQRRVFINRANGFFTSLWSMRAADGAFRPLAVPESAEFQAVLDGQLIMTLVDPLAGFQPGSLVSFDLDALAAGGPVQPKLVLAPTASQSLEQVSTSDKALWVQMLDDVSGKLVTLTHGPRGWSAPVTLPLPANSKISIADTGSKSDFAFVTVENMLSPTRLVAVEQGRAVQPVQALPAQFDAAKFTAEQRFATSKDGTRVPYFLVRKKGVTAPTGVLLHGYGGFRASSLPDYLTNQPSRAGPLGLLWVEDGGAYALANIRGGGEYGPRWHKAALRDKRQNAFDDFAAVAEDLIASGVAKKKGIAISGRSNGGVLTGASITQRPDLYRAAIIGSPLFDMKTYPHLSAGASWIDEYGDPDKPEDWAFMKAWSPYQNIRPGVDYPATFFYLSTKDDRVHPGHARKGAARLKEYGNSVYFHEYLEGGHSVGADREENATRAALLWAFLTKEVGTTDR